MERKTKITRCSCGQETRVLESRSVMHDPELELPNNLPCRTLLHGLEVPVNYKRRRLKCEFCGARYNTIEFRAEDIQRLLGLDGD